MKPVVLLIEDDELVRKSLSRVLRTMAGVEADVYSVERDYVSLFADTHACKNGDRVTHVISDFDLGNRFLGTDVLVEAGLQFPCARRLLMSGGGMREEIQHALNTDIAHAFLEKPMDVNAPEFVKWLLGRKKQA